MEAEKIRELSLACQTEVLALRKYFHCAPELSAREQSTMAAIAAQLQKSDIPFTVIPDGGILAHLDWADANAPDAPHVLLRADCDALPIQESETNGTFSRAYQSAVPGVSHMCGHDAHMAMLLGAAGVLKQLRQGDATLRGRVYLLFERGEEGGCNYYYILKYIQSKKIRIDSCVGLHVAPDLPTGSIWLEEGPGHAGNVNFEIALTGTGGHGSRPNLANNPLDCFVAIANDLNTFRMKCIPPQDILTVNIGSVHCGAKRNIVPQRLEFKGTCRFYNSKSGSRFKKKLRQIITANADLYGCQAEFEVFTGPSMAQLNHREAAALARSAFREVFPEITQIAEKEPEMSSESFGVLCSYYPGMMGLLGTGCPEKGTTQGLHNPQFDLDTDALPYGVAAYAAYAMKYLEENPQFSFQPFPGDIDEMMAYTDRPVPPRLDPEM